MTNLPDEYQPIVDQSLATAIGLLVTEWAGAQWFLVRVLSELMIGTSLEEDDDPTHTAVIIGMDARPLMGLVRSLSKARFNEQVSDEISKILDEMEKVKKLRDLLSHCVWRKHDGKQGMTAFSIKTVGVVKIIERPIVEADIFKSITSLHNLAISLLGYLHSQGYMKLLPPSLGRPY
jgi:hypothetical protein